MTDSPTKETQLNKLTRLWLDCCERIGAGPGFEQFTALKTYAVEVVRSQAHYIEQLHAAAAHTERYWAQFDHTPKGADVPPSATRNGYQCMVAGCPANHVSKREVCDTRPSEAIAVWLDAEGDFQWDFEINEDHPIDATVVLAKRTNWVMTDAGWRLAFVTCNSAGVPPTMPTYRTEHLPTCLVRAAAETPAPLSLDNDRQVFFYEQDHYYLSNFSAFRIRLLVDDGSGGEIHCTFDTSEAAYHWFKFPGKPEMQARIRAAQSAHDAFKLAEQWKPFRRPDWDDVKSSIMLDILRAKVQQHEYVHRKLLATGDRELIENSWRDDVWGWGPNRDGQNLLGKLWMEIRAELRGAVSEKPAETPASLMGALQDVVHTDLGPVRPARSVKAVETEGSRE